MSAVAPTAGAGAPGQRSGTPDGQRRRIPDARKAHGRRRTHSACMRRNANEAAGGERSWAMGVGGSGLLAGCETLW